MLSNMAASLILHKKITTTTAKAKALRVYVEPLITKSKDDSTQSRRVVFDYLQNKEAVAELFREVSPKIAERPGGYTRILKTGNRMGDSAEMCIIELVDFNEAMLAAKTESKTGKRKRRGSGKKKTEGEAKVAAPVVETPSVEKTNEVSAAAPAESTEGAADANESVNEEDQEKKES